MTHEEASLLLGSFALDAVEPDEHERIEGHVSSCPRCRAELDAHREVAGALGNSVEPLPEGLWSSIANRLPERRDEVPPPMPLLRPDRGRSRPDRLHPDRGRLVTVASIAVAAAAVAAVLGVNLLRADTQVAHLQGAIGETAHTAVVAALDTPGHQVVNLVGPDHARVAQFVLIPDGQGYLVKSTLPALRSGRSYQLWGIVGGKAISLGLMGQSPDQVTFTLAGVHRPSLLAVTAEPSGGSVAPSDPIVASGTV
jgi:anti-sigma-K factor RskA